MKRTPTTDKAVRAASKALAVAGVNNADEVAPIALTALTPAALARLAVEADAIQLVGYDFYRNGEIFPLFAGDDMSWEHHTPLYAARDPPPRPRSSDGCVEFANSDGR